MVSISSGDWKRRTPMKAGLLRRRTLSRQRSPSIGSDDHLQGWRLRAPARARPLGSASRGAFATAHGVCPMSTMPRPKTVLPPGIGWQLWTPAALPLLASWGEYNAHPASSMTGAQRALIAETLRCLRAPFPSRALRRTDRLQRAVDALARG